MATAHDEKLKEFENRIEAGDPLSDEEVRELFRVLHMLEQAEDRRAEENRKLSRLLEERDKRRWLDWVGGALVGLILTLLARALGLPV